MDAMIGRKIPKDPRNWTIPSNRPRGWTVTQAERISGRLAGYGSGDPQMRNFWASSRRRFYRLIIVAALLWGGYDLVLSNHGWVRLRAMGIEERGLQEKVSAQKEQLAQVQQELNEDNRDAVERAMREKYNKSRSGEIVYRVRTAPADDSSGAIPGAEPGATRQRGSEHGWIEAGALGRAPGTGNEAEVPGTDRGDPGRR
jgi:cell division protein FtsB